MDKTASSNLTAGIANTPHSLAPSPDADLDDCSSKRQATRYQYTN